MLDKTNNTSILFQDTGGYRKSEIVEIHRFNAQVVKFYGEGASLLCFDRELKLTELKFVTDAIFNTGTY